jgi:hypothetical protein
VATCTTRDPTVCGHDDNQSAWRPVRPATRQCVAMTITTIRQCVAMTITTTSPTDSSKRHKATYPTFDDLTLRKSSGADPDTESSKRPALRDSKYQRTHHRALLERPLRST